VEVPDRPAGLAELLAVLAKNHVDVEYMYSLFTHRNDTAYMVLRISDENAFLKALEGTGIKVVSNKDLDLK
jgi:hypothetical protein